MQCFHFTEIFEVKDDHYIICNGRFKGDKIYDGGVWHQVCLDSQSKTEENNFQCYIILFENKLHPYILSPETETSTKFLLNVMK